MKKLMQVDLSSLATEVQPKKRVYKKRKIIEGLEEKEIERPETGGKSIKSFPIKEKKPPTEKQLAAREKMRLARIAKIEQVKAEKAKLDEEIRLKEEEVQRKKEELAERRRLKREEKKASLPQKPSVQSTPGETGQVEDRGPTISQALQTIAPTEKVLQFRCGNEQPAQESRSQSPEPQTEEETTPKSPQRQKHTLQVPNAPKREYVQRFRSYPFGKSVPTQPRFR